MEERGRGCRLQKMRRTPSGVMMRRFAQRKHRVAGSPFGGRGAERLTGARQHCCRRVTRCGIMAALLMPSGD